MHSLAPYAPTTGRPVEGGADARWRADALVRAHDARRGHRCPPQASCTRRRTRCGRLRPSRMSLIWGCSRLASTNSASRPRVVTARVVVCFKLWEQSYGTQQIDSLTMRRAAWVGPCPPLVGPPCPIEGTEGVFTCELFLGCSGSTLGHGPRRLGLTPLK